MSNTYPTEEKLKQLICEAFDELPSPDASRLTSISGRLNSQLPGRRQRSGQQWLFWLLLGSSLAAAAWWGGTDFIAARPTLSPAAEKRPTTGSTQRQNQTFEPSPEQAVRQPTSPPDTDSANHIIYQRELY